MAMILPLYPLDAFGYEGGLVLGLLIGFGFGFVLERAGFGQAPQLAAQFYFADMRVLKVMFMAIVTALLGTTVLAGAGVLDYSLLTVPETFLWPQLAGGLLLGVGFIVSGYCPGTSVVAAASGNIDGWMTVLGVMVGSLAYGIFHPWIADFEMSGAMGVVRFPDVLGVPQAVVAAGVAMMAIGMFFGGEALERLFARKRGNEPPLLVAGTRNRVFGGVAVAAAVGAALLLAPLPTQATSPKAFGAVDALTLARTLVERPESIHLVDLRDSQLCAAERIPGAACLTADDPTGAFVAELPATRTLVLYGSGDMRALPPSAQRFSGEVLVLRGGFGAFQRQILTAPPVPQDPTPEALDRYRLVSALYAKFTGAASAPAPVAPVRPVVRPAGAKKGGGC
jgi:uncharacterized membrane protein YedE/YeeE